MKNEQKAREYLLKEHSSILNVIMHQCDLKTEMQYHTDIENAFIAGAKWKDEQYEEEKKDLRGLVNMLPMNENNQTIIEDLKAMLQ